MEDGRDNQHRKVKPINNERYEKEYIFKPYCHSEQREESEYICLCAQILHFVQDDNPPTFIFQLSSCTSEDEVPSLASASLHITSVTIDGGEVASRVAYEGEGTDSYNRSVTGFEEGDKLGMVYGFGTFTNKTAYLTKTATGWSITDAAGNALDIRPASGEKWEDFTGSVLYN